MLQIQPNMCHYAFTNCIINAAVLKLMKHFSLCVTFLCEILFSPSRIHSYPESVSESDEEHRLIARYTARLASESKYPVSQAKPISCVEYVTSHVVLVL